MANPANRDRSGPDRQEFIASVDALRKAVERALEPNDLGRLAQMHTACQTLSALDGAAGQLATAVASLLEAIILKEAADTAGGLALIPAAVKQIGEIVDGQDADPTPLLAQLRAATGERGNPQAVADVAAGARQAVSGPPSLEAGIDEYVGEPLVVNLDEREHLEAFITECREHVDAIEVALLALEGNPGDRDTINELFRPFHTIKGAAAFLNLRDINRLTHEMETILDLGRTGRLTITAEMIDLFFSGVDALKQQAGSLAGYLANPSGETVPQPDIVEILTRLRAVAATRDTPVAPDIARHPPEPVGTGCAVGAGIGDSEPASEASIRVDTAKLDQLVDAVGELVIAQTMVGTSGIVATDEKLAHDVSRVSKIVRNIQETAMAMRMIPIGHTFRRMRRLVRDVARRSGKQVALRINGEETELDRNVIQAIADPLIHLVRNAVDHGIETAERRRAAGKSETGTVHLNAFHQGDSIVIEIGDDGSGLDRAQIIAKGIQRGLIARGDQLSDQQVFNLTLQPGFSTAEQITEISGRGVGLDVVKRNVEQLRGKIEIDSKSGRGSTFSIRLPLTLAIIDGMLVRVGDQRLIIPTMMVEQALRPEPRQIIRVQRRGAMIQVRGELITLVQLGPLFGFCGPIDAIEASIVIAQTEGNKIGIVVDELLGQQQVVIKTLGERFKPARGISGAAILGDGRVGLILEPNGLLALHNTCAVVAEAGRTGAEPKVSQAASGVDDQPRSHESPGQHGVREPANPGAPRSAAVST